MDSSSTTHRSEPLISIVIGVLNGARTLERCLDSISGQTFQSRELVVQDGGSKDGTVEILQRRSSEIAHWNSSSDGGLYEAWNKALDHCRGNWICFLGCDDEFAYPESLGTVAKQTHAANDPELICALAALTGDDGKFIRIVGRPWNWQEMKRTQLVAHPGLLHRADLFARYGRFKSTYRVAGDYEFLLRLGSQTRAAFVDQVTIRMGAKGMSHKLFPRAFRENWKAQAHHPEIGRIAATRNYGVAWAKTIARKTLGRG